MDDHEDMWWTGWTIAGVIVGAVAALLLAIIGTARSIHANAERALAAANAIVTNTRPIWDLAQTNQAATTLLNTAREIEEHAHQAADALE